MSGLGEFNEIFDELYTSVKLLGSGRKSQERLAMAVEGFHEFDDRLFDLSRHQLLYLLAVLRRTPGTLVREGNRNADPVRAWRVKSLVEEAGVAETFQDRANLYFKIFDSVDEHKLILGFANQYALEHLPMTDDATEMFNAQVAALKRRSETKGAEMPLLHVLIALELLHARFFVHGQPLSNEQVDELGDLRNSHMSAIIAETPPEESIRQGRAMLAEVYGHSSNVDYDRYLFGSTLVGRTDSAELEAAFAVAGILQKAELLVTHPRQLIGEGPRLFTDIARIRGNLMLRNRAFRVIDQLPEERRQPVVNRLDSAVSGFGLARQRAATFIRQR